MERLERPSGRREASSTLSWKMSEGESGPGPGVDTSGGSNSWGLAGFRKGDMGEPWYPDPVAAKGGDAWRPALRTAEAEEESRSPDASDGT